MLTANFLWKVKNLNAFKKWGGFWKTKCFHSFSSTLTESKRRKTINTISVPWQGCQDVAETLDYTIVSFRLYINIFGDEKKDILAPLSRETNSLDNGAKMSPKRSLLRLFSFVYTVNKFGDEKLLSLPVENKL